ncbi:MAG: LuxR C-terminal-related transcriptional regulator [Acidobacteriia bacterium]|nr:LuxR C-terminal-related transcriptional regulator [Terriglobia bacterium]
MVLIRQGKRNRRIAQELDLTEDTVKCYLNRLYKKLGVASRTELAVRATTRPFAKGDYAERPKETGVQSGGPGLPLDNDRPSTLSDE